MNLPFLPRLALAAPIAAAAIWLGIGGALAQAPAPSPTPSASSSPAPAASESPAPAPSAASPAPAASASPAPAPSVVTADPFGEATTLSSRKVIILGGNANPDSIFDALMDSLKALTAFLDKQGIKPAGNAMIVYTSTDDTGFAYLAEIPVEQDPKNLGKGMSMGKSPEGKALKFVHRGSYDNIEDAYEAITNHVEDKKVETKDIYIEEYQTDPLKTAEDKLVINIYVPLK
jgi:effector-binding domain-containing protein